MLFANVPLTDIRGDTLLLGFQVTNQDGDPADITGVTPSMSIRDFHSGLALAESPADLTVVITDAPAGLFMVVAAKEVTQTFRGLYRYQVHLEDLSGNRQTVVVGTLHFMEPGTPAP